MEKFKVGDLVRVKEPFNGILPTENLRIDKLDVPCTRNGVHIKGHQIYRETASNFIPLGEDRLVKEFTAVPGYITRTVESASFPQAMWRLPIE